MMDRFHKPFTLGLLVVLAVLSLPALAPDKRITLPDGRRIFVAGFNLAWINFANDVGDRDLDLRAFRKAMKAVADAGGNTMRVWLSTNGSRDPVFGSDGLVSGLGNKTIGNVKKMLAVAKEHNMLLMPVLLTHNFMQRQSGVDLERNRRLLTTDEGLEAYIKYALVPLVSAIGQDPNLLCWEIANEPEGMVEGVGWTDERISRLDVQIFTNRMTGAIRRAVPGVLVTTGTVTADKLLWYLDNALVQAGGDPDGVLDFYTFHYYGWNGPANSPFTRPASFWRMDKPVMVGEFPSSSWSPSTKSSSPLKDSGDIDRLLPALYDGGYAGGLYWQYQAEGAVDSWLKGFRTAGPALKAFVEQHAGDVTLPAPAN